MSATCSPVVCHAQLMLLQWMAVYKDLHQAPRNEIKIKCRLVGYGIGELAAETKGRLLKFVSAK
jgi:hypothetical protein